MLLLNYLTSCTVPVFILGLLGGEPPIILDLPPKVVSDLSIAD